MGSKVVRTALSLGAIAALFAGPAAGTSAADDPVVTAGAASVEVTLREGDRGPAVRRVQRRLRIGADGVFGPQTHRAVKRFQRRKRLTSDGVVGPVTRRALGLKPFARNSVVHPRGTGGRPGPGAGGGLRNLPAVLVKIALCESGGNPRAVSPGGEYRGKYQFTRATWKSSGGRGRDPSKASERHQDRIALRLFRARGTAPWPSCA